MPAPKKKQRGPVADTLRIDLDPEEALRRLLQPQPKPQTTGRKPRKPRAK